MDSEGVFIATLIDHSAKALAAGTVMRLQEMGRGDVETWGFQELVKDVEVRLNNLSESLAVGGPELFELDVAWLAGAYTARELSVDSLERTLDALAAELGESLPDTAADKARTFVESAKLRLAEGSHAVPSLLTGDGPEVRLAQRLLLAMLQGSADEAQHLLVEALEGGTDVTSLHGVIALAQAEMGRMWQTGEVHAAEEHLGSRIVEEALTVLRSRAPRAPRNGRSVLVSSVVGNLHSIGGRMVADHFELSGWRSLFFGADTPTEDLVLAVGQFEADVVALSVGLGLNMRGTAELISAIQRSHPDVPVLVGGRPFAALPELWRAVGADGFAPDAESSVREATRLLEARAKPA